MDIDYELSQYNVSRETVLKLEAFAALLKEWNQKMNLISRNSLEVLWERHILDSAQLIKYIPESAENILDIGSGAGFPAIVLAILLQEKKPAMKLVLVESITKKTVYLNDVCSKLGLSNVVVRNARIENMLIDKPDVVTARAVASLNVLCGYLQKISKKNTESLFLKGRSYKEEVKEAQKFWKFKMKVYANKYCEDGVVLQISEVRKNR